MSKKLSELGVPLPEIPNQTNLDNVGKDFKDKRFDAVDSEFKVGYTYDESKGDVHSFQWSNGIDMSDQNTKFFESADALKKFISGNAKGMFAPKHHRVLYGFAALCDIGSLGEWLGDNILVVRQREGNSRLWKAFGDGVKLNKSGLQHKATVRYSGAEFRIVDARPLLASFGMHRLLDVGLWVGSPKLRKPEWLGERKWETEKEYQEFKEYAKLDAFITSRGVKKMVELYNADPAVLVSAGSYAKHFFKFPKRFLRNERGYYEPDPVEETIRQWTFAGRNEGFVAGFVKDVHYNDVSSLYPVAMLAVRALMIKGWERCKFEDLNLELGLDSTLDRSGSGNVSFGWVKGVFDVPASSDLWGLPLKIGKEKHEINHYMVGDGFVGWYNTFDIMAAKVSKISAIKCYRPVFYGADGEWRQKLFNELLLHRLHDDYVPDLKDLVKAVMNSSSGKLAGAKPEVGATSNFLAYNMLLGYSHLIMSRLFDASKAKFGSFAEPLGMDTDSIFCHARLDGDWFRVGDGVGNEADVGVAVKGINMDGVVSAGDLAFFRSKRYILWDKKRKRVDGVNPVFARTGWFYPFEDYINLYSAELNELKTRIDIKHTLLSETKAAQIIPYGHWLHRLEVLDLAKIKSLLMADRKRKRDNDNYDSYGLVRRKECAGSRAWTLDETMSVRMEIPWTLSTGRMTSEQYEELW